ncbi:MAG: tripartite tricarboxylate transporter substrate binding protein [Variovorax sp.]|nr:MAG: tripartite tricarboxylate transporter substrate binding protein [Variovorax sp.]
MTQLHTRRRVVAGAAALGAALGLPRLVFGQVTFPDKSKTIKAIVPFGPGATVDVLGRVYAQQVGRILDTTIVVDNRPGAEGVLGVQAAKTAPADGYTYLCASISTQVVNPHFFKKPPYESQKDFIPIAGTMKTPFVMIAGPNLPFKTVKEFVAAAKSEPGKFTFASISSATRLAGEMFAKAAGIQLLNIPYKNQSDFISDTLANRVNVFFADPGNLIANLSLGLRGLAACTKTPLSRLPEIPTLESQGIPLEIVGYHSAYVPAGTPANALGALIDAFRKAEASKAVRDYIASTGNEPMTLFGDEFAAYERAEFDRWGKAAREAGLAGTL